MIDLRFHDTVFTVNRSIFDRKPTAVIETSRHFASDCYKYKRQCLCKRVAVLSLAGTSGQEMEMAILFIQNILQ